MPVIKSAYLKRNHETIEEVIKRVVTIPERFHILVPRARVQDFRPVKPISTETARLTFATIMSIIRIYRPNALDRGCGGPTKIIQFAAP